MTPEEIAELERLCAEATPAEQISLCRYPHGGGRLASPVGWEDLTNRAEGGDLIADFYDEANREFYYAARTALPTLLAERREREAKLAAYERRERHVCGDPSAECDGDCAHEGWQGIALRESELKRDRAEKSAVTLSLKLGEAEAKLARVEKLPELWEAIALAPDADPALIDCLAELREALSDPPRTAGGTDHD